MRAVHFTPAVLLFSFVSARVISPKSAIANLARIKRQDGDDLTIDGVDINFAGCDEINPKTGKSMKTDIINAWDDAIDLANAVTEIDTNTDIGSFDCMGYKILSVYNNLGSFGRNFFWGWRVNAFCPSEDANLWRLCDAGHVAFQWDTMCKDGRCPCAARNDDGSCKQEGDNKIDRNPDDSYINIQFCPSFFQYSSLKEVVDSGKNAPKEEKYSMNSYWNNRGKILFHEILHGATVGMHANENLMITDLKIKIRKQDKPEELEEVGAYGPLNSKMLARTIRNENFNHVRQNDDNWSAYALEVGVYPILPLADDHVYGDNAQPPPSALFLSNGDQTLVNTEIYNNDAMFDPQHYVRPLAPEESIEAVQDPTFRPDSDYPEWYIERLKKARAGDLDGTGKVPGEPETPPSNPEPTKEGKTLQLFWEVELANAEPGFYEPPPPKYWWYFYLGNSGTGSDPCNADPIDTQFGAPAGDSWPEVVEGEWEFDIPDMGKCKYQGIGRVGPGGDNGWLHCPDRPAIICVPDQRPVDECGSDTTMRSKAISYCDW
ncbi:hypothetical protein EJ04DRAFT_503396 [Polyplosphaeria fusca]|uniref:Uncharacterized protein n=1 Tax=Polyplosphaeria fusca TaxID=682080 RepID=A0A9P4QQ61_9PLEO|nr:hypothetical protein EJ04DRAFT_503396 [Polyplosphaeria fusca]